MHWKFTPLRLALLIGLVGLFWFLDGFRFPELHETTFSSPRRLARVWPILLLLYLGGAALVSVVDYGAGTNDRTNLRILNFVVGVLCMIASVFLLRALTKPEQSSLPFRQTAMYLAIQPGACR